MNVRIIAYAMMSLISSAAWAGVGSRGGGEATSQAYVGQAWITYHQLSRAYPKGVPTIDLAKLKNAIETTTVDFVDRKLELDGIEKDMINDLETRRIEINISRYLGMTNLQQKKLNFHEYLRLAGVDDSNYQVSNPVLLALEGDPLVALEDSLSRTLVRLSQIDRSSPKAICYDMAGLVPMVRQVVRQASEAGLAEDKKFFSDGANRLKFWIDVPEDYCKAGKIYSSGAIKKATPSAMNLYLTLMERDLKATQAELLHFVGRSGSDWNRIWEEYRSILRKSSR